MTRLARQDGFTLVELLVSMVLMLLITGATLSAFASFDRNARASQVQNDAQEAARAGIDRMARELRNVASGQGQQPEGLDRIDPYDLVLRDVDPVAGAQGANARGVRRVRYCLAATGSTGTLWRQTQGWTTATPPPVPADTACPGSGWNDRAVVAQHVANRQNDADRPIWSYDAATPADVRSVRFELYVDRDPARRPAATRLVSGVVLRNQNRRPIAAFLAEPQESAKVLLNGSASYDPEGDTLRYVWHADGVPARNPDGTACEGVMVTCTFARSGVSYRISLRVYDVTGLEGVAPEQAVTTR